MTNQYFTVYWKDGNKQYIRGETAQGAFQVAGIGRGALRAVDFYNEGLCQGYCWSTLEHHWVKASPSEYINLFQMVVMGVRFQSFHINFIGPVLKEKGIFFYHQNDTSCIVRTADLEKIWDVKFS